MSKIYPERLDQYQLVALYVAVNDRLMACGHWYSVGRGYTVSSYGGVDLLRFGLIRSVGTVSVPGARGRTWTGEVFEPTEEGRGRLPDYLELGPSDCDAEHWREVLEFIRGEV